MKQTTLFILVIFVYLSALGQEKSRYDLKFPINNPNSSESLKGASKSLNIDYENLENDKTGFSLLSDAYFTIGTTNGVSTGPLDDHCQITFGHPFALTSYTFFKLDEVEYHPEIYFYDAPKEIINQGDTLLRLFATDLEKIAYTFDISQLEDGNTIRLQLSIKNIDDIAHSIGMGLMYDPALGLWGDGFAFVDQQWITSNTILQNDIPTSFEIWERSIAPKGLGMQFNYTSNQPSRLIFGNWIDLHKIQTPAVNTIYDLGIKTEWDEILLEAEEEISFIVDIQLNSPEFPNGVFMRSDIPYFLSIENNLLFPRHLRSMIKLFNNSGIEIINANIDLEGDAFVEDWSSPDTLILPSQNTVFTSALLNVPENYEDKSILLELSLMDGEELVDQIKRNLYVPAAPLSDSGLVVTIDTIILSEFPTIDLIFKSQIEETGQYLKELTQENVFFYEENIEIDDFSLAKDTTGGVNQADIIFVLDVTGSMSDEIDGVVNNISEFADSLSAQGVDFRLGMVTFLDVIENIYDFTSDVQLFQQYLDDQYAHGGGDMPENSLEALMTACQFEFRPNAHRVFVWITDAAYHINNSYTQLTPQIVVNEMLSHSIVPHGIGGTGYQLDYFNPILFPTGGEFYDINGNFRDILLNISRLNSTGVYRLSYLSNANPGDYFEDVVEIHYAGLGGMDTIAFNAPSKSLGTNDLAEIRYFPNPSLSHTRIEIDNPQKLEAKLRILNALGQQVAVESFESGNTTLSFNWNPDEIASKGLYFIHCELYDSNGETISLPVMKLVYVK